MGVSRVGSASRRNKLFRQADLTLGYARSGFLSSSPSGNSPALQRWGNGHPSRKSRRDERSPTRGGRSSLEKTSSQRAPTLLHSRKSPPIPAPQHGPQPE